MERVLSAQVKYAEVPDGAIFTFSNTPGEVYLIEAHEDTQYKNGMCIVNTSYYGGHRHTYIMCKSEQGITFEEADFGRVTIRDGIGKNMAVSGIRLMKSLH